MNPVKHELRKLLWKTGLDVIPFDPGFNPLARRKRFLEYYEIDVVLDVGANTGQYAIELRKDLGYTGKIISFEPMTSAFEVLKGKAAQDSQWLARNHALGDQDGQDEINISGNSYSSSLLNILPKHTDVEPSSGYVGTEKIKINKLDSIFSSLGITQDRSYLKIDTQGFESKVIAGAGQALDSIYVIQLEMALVPLYQGELLFPQMYQLLADKGYQMISIDPGFSDSNSGQVLQVEGVFCRK